MRRDIIKAIGLATWVAGVLSLAIPMIRAVPAGKSPLSALAGAGRSMFGTPADPDGAQAMALGAAGHFLIALMAAALFVLAARKLPQLVRRPWLWGVLYGVGLHLALPGKAPEGAGAIALAIVIDVVTMGLPIALITAKVMRPDVPLVPRAPDPRLPPA